jgi:hypothetical protein
MKKVGWVIIWAIAFGFVEASVVEYLRALYYPLTEGGFHFPILSLAHFESLGPEHIHRLKIEIVREFCTLIMLATVGAAAAKNRREAWAHFMIAFGVWDIFFYVWLRVFLDWPASLMTWDLLFLIPVPWVGPVIAPVMISIALIVAGLMVLFFEDKGRPLLLKSRDWLLIVIGGVIVIVSFCWDYKNIMGGGFPDPFEWKIFFTGLILSATTFALLVRRHLSQGSELS